MKTLYLVRHAKSSWDEVDLSDHERPLAKRGKHDAPMMGKILAEREEKPDFIISSPAKRAYSTAKRMAKEFDYSTEKIHIDESLYMGDTDDFYKVIQSTSDEFNRIMLFSHNPEITYFANSAASANIDNIPTCGVVRVDFETNSWKEIKNKKGKLVFFDYPKKYKT